VSPSITLARPAMLSAPAGAVTAIRKAAMSTGRMAVKA
jgi:hypothetical protein